MKWFMKKDTELWLQYADENLKSAEVLMKNSLYNPSLQNALSRIQRIAKFHARSKRLSTVP